MTIFFYSIFLKLYSIGISIASLWNDKARLWIKGRKRFPAIEFSDEKKDIIWMHCASFGEFEQGRPLIEEIRKQYPHYNILITFFSPSGYEIVKKFKVADYIFYLPIDSASNAKKFITVINPTLVLWIKYDYWYFYLQELKNKNIPTLLISGSLRKDHHLFNWNENFGRKIFTCFTYLFVQNEYSEDLLQKINIKNVIVSGDTRFDRVITTAENFDEVPFIKEFCGRSKVIVAGSTWEDDEAILLHYVQTNIHIKFIIAPHEIDKENINSLKKKFSGSVLYSEWLINNTHQNTGNEEDKLHISPDNQPTTNCLIIDNIGILSRLYKYADIAYVGGGFGDDGLHNILEAAVFGKPVIFGPVLDKNFEAQELIESGGGISITNAVELEKTFTQIVNDEDELKKRSMAAKNYVYNNLGATKIIMEYIQENRLLTN